MIDKRLQDSFFESVGLGVVYFGFIEDELKIIAARHMRNKNERKKVLKSPMGYVLAQIKKMKILHDDDITFLQKNKNYRNEIIHHAQDIFYGSDGSYTHNQNEIEKQMRGFVTKFKNKERTIQNLVDELIRIRSEQ